MRALRVHGFNGPQDWRIENVSEPEPGPGEVLVRVLASSISYVDLLLARGGYQVKPTVPFTPGTEMCGVIERVGPGVGAGFMPGVKVVGTAFGGCWAEKVSVPTQWLWPMPDGGDAAALSGLAVTSATALYALRNRAALQKGEAVLVLGAAGGVGLSAVQIAQSMGACVIGVASGDVKLEAVRAAGANHTIDFRQGDLKEAVRRLAPGGAVDVVVDLVGGNVTEAAFRTLRWGGRHLVVGFANGEIPSFRTNLPLLKGAALVGVDIRQFREREPAASQRNLAALCELVQHGAVRPRVASTVSIEYWPSAMEAAMDRSTIGRVVLAWDQSR
jgi:NADPH2:quinone reductase